MFFFFVFFFPLVEKLKFNFPKERAKTRLLKFSVKPIVLSMHLEWYHFVRVLLLLRKKFCKQWRLCWTLYWLAICLLFGISCWKNLGVIGLYWLSTFVQYLFFVIWRITTNILKALFYLYPNSKRSSLKEFLIEALVTKAVNIKNVLIRTTPKHAFSNISIIYVFTSK